MVRCEVCGREIRGPPYRRVIEGARLVVCEQCSRFSSEEWSPKPPAPPPRARPRRRNDVESAETLIPAEGYGALLRESREKLRMEHKDFARFLGEKVSTVKMLEKEELVPDQALAQKIKRLLKIDVFTRETTKTTTFLPSPQKGAPTIGDMVKLKEKKDKESNPSP